MSDLHLAEPAYAHGLWGVVLFVVLLFLAQRRGTALLERLMSPVMQLRLVWRPSPMRRLARCGLLGGTAALLVLALMRPQWGIYYERTPRAGTELMICLDVSKSMLAEDVAPNRLERAKAEVTDLLDYLDGDHVGLVAFAGKATVLCPLTPDFSFLRLVLDSAGPHSVARGGTQLSAPILQSIDGFGGAGDVSRAILLITDGEDHDSFVIEAAEQAAERGIKIFTVGFGSESGSQIMVTDRSSGARTVLTDGDGQAVISRLDGDTLRDIALKTEGAYIPAGTGVLDLESIYRDLLAPLTRGQLDGRGRAVRNEGFQWAILLAMLALVAGVALTSGRARGTMAQRSGMVAGCLIGFLLIAPATFAQAPPQTTDAPGATPGEPSETNADPVEKPESSAAPGDNAATPPKPPKDARKAYNLGLASLSSDQLETAERQLTAARRQAGADGTARYRATYNLGWVYVKRHDAALEQEPEQALKHLYTAASWFRDAVRLRPDEIDARHNLEVVMRKALALADSLRKDGDQDLAKRLDELIKRQQEFVAQARVLTTRAASTADTNALESFRRDFRDLAAEQRKILSDSSLLADDAAEERDAIESKTEDQRTPEENIRAAQLGATLHYLYEAGERLGQARRQLKQQRGERGCRRCAAGLRKLRRARDQLRDPPAIIGAIITDTVETMQHAIAQAMTMGLGDIALDGQADAPRPQAPPWLTLTYLQESQEELTQRADELYARLEAGLPGQEAEDAPPPEDPESQRFLEQLREALPFIGEGRDALRQATDHLQDEAVEPAIQEQQRAITALLEAQERFLDIRGLIEVLYRSQTQLLEVARSEDVEVRERILEILPALITAEDKDIERLMRLRELVEEAIAELPEPPADPNATPPPAKTMQKTPPAEQDPERQRLQVAQQYVDLIAADVAQTRENIVAIEQQDLEKDTETEPAALEDTADPASMEHTADAGRTAAPTSAETDTAAGTSPVPPTAEARAMTAVHEEIPTIERSLSMIEELRRLFFSIIEHLRDTARRQEALYGDTAEAAALPDETTVGEALGPLIPRQSGLSTIAGEIATALQQQATQPPQPPPGQTPQQPAGPSPEEQQEMQQRMARASELVAAAQGEMDEAVAGLEAEPRELDAAQQHQQTALQQLLEALKILQPPQDQQQQQDDQQQQQQQEEQQEQEQQEQQKDLAQLLQAVRDREAQRRAEREQNKPSRYQPVDKDW